MKFRGENMKKIVMFFMVIFLILQCLLITSVAENANEESKPKEFIDIPTNKAYGFGIY